MTYVDLICDLVYPSDRLVRARSHTCRTEAEARLFAESEAGLRKRSYEWVWYRSWREVKRNSDGFDVVIARRQEMARGFVKYESEEKDAGMEEGERRASKNARARFAK